jgi:hypothetical protein
VNSKIGSTLLLSATLILGAHALAEDTAAPANAQTQADLKDVQPKDSGEENKISNPRLSADAGARSKHSFRAVLGYSGGSLEKPFDKLRPNYMDLEQNVLTATSLGGSLGYGYRIDATSQLRVTTSVSILTPFHNTWENYRTNEIEYNNTKLRTFNVDGIYTEYNKTFQAGNLIHSPSIGLSLPTSSFDRDVVGTLAGVDLGYAGVWDVEGTGFQPGLAIGYSQIFYSDGSDLDKEGRPRVNSSLGLYPSLEYQVNDLIGLRTVLGYFNYVSLRGESTFERNPNYISMGVGFAPTQELWFYPNVQFNPDNARMDKTNFGFSAIINL